MWQVDSEQEKKCERISNICVLKSVILVKSVGKYRNKLHITVQKTWTSAAKRYMRYKIHLLIGLLNKDRRFNHMSEIHIF